MWTGNCAILPRSEGEKVTTTDECVIYGTVIKEIRKESQVINSNLNEVGQF